jgi:hypothetical protein
LSKSAIDKNEFGKLAGIVGVMADITDKREREKLKETTFMFYYGDISDFMICYINLNSCLHKLCIVAITVSPIMNII